MARVIFANPISSLGGAELFLLEMLSQVRNLCPDWELHLISGAEGPLLERACALGVTTHCEPLPESLASMGDSQVHAEGAAEWRRIWRLGNQSARGLGDVLRYIHRLKNLMNDLQPDLIHSNGLKMHGLTGLSCPRSCRLVWFMHDYLTSRVLMRRALPWVSNRVSQLIANSQSVANDVRQVMPRIPISVVHCGIDLERFSPAQGQPHRLDELACLNPIAANSLRVGLVATYARWKGHDIFLRSAAAVSAQFPNARFYLIGGPIYASAGSQYSVDELRGLIHSFGLDGIAGLVPFQTETSWVYRSLDVFVHASQQPEPFGRTILEAMACGTPTIAMEVGGAAEIFVPEVSGLGTRPGSAECLAEALRRILGDAALRQRLGLNARQRALQFSEAKVGAELTAIYHQLLGSAPKPETKSAQHD